MKRTRFLFTLMTLFLTGIMSYGQTTTGPSGLWNSTSSWTPATVPVPTAIANVLHSMIIDTNISIDGSSGNFGVYTINPGGILDVVDISGGTAHTLTITNTAGYNAARAIFDVVSGRVIFEGNASVANGTIRVRAGATLIIGGTLSIATGGKIIVDDTGTLIVKGNISDGTATVLADQKPFTINGFVHVYGEYVPSGSGARFYPTTPTTGFFIAKGRIDTGGTGSIFGQLRGHQSGSTFSSAHGVRCGGTSTVSNHAKITASGMVDYNLYGCSPASFPQMTFSLQTSYTNSTPVTTSVMNWQVSTSGPGWGFADIGGASTATYTPTSGQTVDKWYRMRYRLSGCSTVDMYTYPVAQLVTPSGNSWTGTISTDWNDRRNWQMWEVPNPLTDVYILSSATYQPTVSSDVSIRSLTINSGATVTQNDLTKITLNCGDLVNNGTLTATNPSTVEFKGGTQALSGSSTTEFKNLSIDGSTTTFNQNANLINTLTLSNSATFDADGSSSDKIFWIKSTGPFPYQTGRIAEIPSGSSITGKVRVQRYMDAYHTDPYTGWVGATQADITSPVQNAPVSEFQNYVRVTGSFTGKSTISGCNACNIYKSMTYWLEGGVSDTDGNGTLEYADNFIPFPISSNSETFEVGRGYQVFRYGSDYGDTNVTWSLTGIPNQGTINVPITYRKRTKPPVGDIRFADGGDDGYNQIGNPYASAINIDSVILTTGPTTGWVSVYDEEIDPDPSADPVFRHYNVHTGLHLNDNGRQVSKYIQTGQAFWVQYDYSGLSLSEGQQVSSNVVFKESAKTSETSLGEFMASNSNSLYSKPNMTPSYTKLIVALNKGSQKREFAVGFFDGATTGFDYKYDMPAYSDVNTKFFAGTITSGVQYEVNSLPIADISNTEVGLISYTASGQSYSFTWSASEFSSDIKIMLYDDYNGNKVDMNLNSSYAWTANANSTTPRFRIKFFPKQTVSNLSPTFGAVGSTVYINGTNFSTTPSENIVKFNGVTATVTGATSTQLTVTVPVGATTGSVTVEKFGYVVTGPTFTVSTPVSVTINSKTKSSAVGSYYVYYKVGSGSWTLAYSSSSSTSCTGKVTLNSLNSGEYLYIAVENSSGYGIEYFGQSGSSCSSTATGNGGDRVNTCSGVSRYQYLIPTSNSTISLTVNTSFSNYVTCN